jgi:hypothetical protein
MGHCAEYGCVKKSIFPALGAHAVDLVLSCGVLRRSWQGALAIAQGLFLRYGPLHSVWLCPKGHSATCGLMERAIAQDMVLHALGPMSKNWFCAMGNNAKSSYLQWVIALNFVICYGPLQQIWLCDIDKCTEYNQKNLQEVVCLGQSAGFDIVLWTTASCVQLCTTGHSAKQIARAQNHHFLFKKLDKIL